jgi:nicotianamine synthase
MSFACEDVTKESGSNWESFEVMFLASLVGTDTHTKLSILASLAKKLTPGTLVVARSAQGMRSVLYPVGFSSCDTEWVGTSLTWTDPRAL